MRIVPLAVTARIRPSHRTRTNARLDVLEERIEGFDKAIALFGQREPDRSEIVRQRGHLKVIRGGRP